MVSMAGLDPLGGAPSGFRLFFGVVVTLVVLGFVAVFATVAYRAKAARRAGLDPLAGDIQLAGQLRRSALLAPAGEGKTTAARLAELDTLHRSGAITDEEWNAQRARVLSEL
ncbi:SHOCT domain-containing protein [Oryzihumus leptocrescens]|uniref:Uncharacterized protein n=1 Tax=Oryzihumus leptocrescens TaxID=297536 RepID=A0A542ZGS3_9MICO|nr:SHOCT domain-containing protein [Oryzihumus leptocrescens]TQL59543.1 hypothetical protein FB474_0898 [Oryzihumus leptocrescens]